MIDNKIYLGKIEDYDDYDRASVIFSIPNLVEKGKAYSMYPEKKPAVGDEIILFKMNSQLNAMWYYLNINQTGQFIIEYNGSNIIMQDGKIFIQAKEIHLNNKQDERNVTEGNQAIVYGNELKDWLESLIDLLSTTYSVITTQGPSTAVSPAAIMKLNKLKAQTPKFISDYAKILK